MKFIIESKRLKTYSGIKQKKILGPNVSHLFVTVSKNMFQNIPINNTYFVSWICLLTKLLSLQNGITEFSNLCLRFRIMRHVHGIDQLHKDNTPSSSRFEILTLLIPEFNTLPSQNHNNLLYFINYPTSLHSIFIFIMIYIIIFIYPSFIP